MKHDETFAVEAWWSSAQVKASQQSQWNLRGLVEFLQEQTNDHISDNGQFCRRWPLLLCGTLNFNGRKGLMESWNVLDPALGRGTMTSTLMPIM